MKQNEEHVEEIRGALEREAERRFDAARLHRSVASRGRFTAWSPGLERKGFGPFGRLPIAVQWLGLAAALLGAALGVRSLYLEQTRGFAAPSQASSTVSPQVPPGAGAATSNPSAAPAPTLHDSEPELVAPEPPRRAPRKARPELIAEATPPAPEAEPVAEAPHAGWAGPTGRKEAPRTVGGNVAGLITTAQPGQTADEPPSAAKPPARVEAVFPGIGVVAGGALDQSLGGVRVLSAKAGGRTIRPEIREAPEVGATLVVLPAVAAFSAQRVGPRRHLRPASAAPEFMLAADVPSGRVFGPKDESTPGDGIGADPVEPTGGAYYVRMFVGSGFEPPVPRSHGLMGDRLQVIPLREQEVWGDEEQENFLERNFRLTSITAVDGARIEPDGTGVAESSFFAGVGGQVLGVSIHAAPGEADGTHQIELRLFRTDGRVGDSPERANLLSATLLVDNGRIVVLGIPESDAAVGPRRGPRVAFLAMSPRFGMYEPSRNLDRVLTIEGDVEPPLLVESTQPAYTQEALDQRAEGKVVLRVVIRRDGDVDGIQVMRVPKVPGGEYLMEAATRAVRQWRYLPARLHGEPVNVYFTVVVNFTLNPDGGT